MSNDRMQAALATAIASVAELQAAWIQQLAPDRLQQLFTLTEKGMRVGFVFVGGAQPFAKIVTVDSANGWVTLSDIELTKRPTH